MRFLNDLYPEIAQQETLTVRMENDALLPNGDYAFLEHFCDNLACRCTTVLLGVVSLNDKEPKKSKQIATINYAWEKPISKRNPSLNKEEKQSGLAKAALTVFRHLVKNNGFIAERMNKHFEMVRNHVRQEKKSAHLQNHQLTPKTKRNDPCPCGSNKKYKKCCFKN